MMIVPLSYLQTKKGTLPTSRMWMDARFTSAVDMLPVDNSLGYEK